MVEETANKIKSYINEITLTGEKDSYDLQALRKCFDSFELTEEELEKLEQIASVHVRRSEDLLGKRNITGAILSMERAVEIHPLFDEYRNRMAQLYLMKSSAEGNSSAERELARKSALFSLRLKTNNPIARNILKEIKKTEDSISGRHLNKKLIFPLIALIAIVIAALLSQNRFTLLFLNPVERSGESSSTTDEIMQKTAFTEREVNIRVTGPVEDCELEVGESLISKTNGSFSYTLQGELSHPTAALKSAELNITFRSFQGDALFRKSYALIDDDELVMPGEPILIDKFFYVHYLPPEIDRVDLSLKNLAFADEIPQEQENNLLSVEWDAPRPEGVKLNIYTTDSAFFKGYGQDYANIKLKIENLGLQPVSLFHIDLNWRDSFGDMLYSVSQELIQEDNRSLGEGENRIFKVFTAIPPSIQEKEAELYITVKRINS